MSKMHRICDLEDCIEIEKTNFVKAKKDMELAVDQIMRIYQQITEILRKK